MRIKNIEKIIHNQPCKKVVIQPNTSSFRICCDGEIQDAGDITFEIINNAFNFVLPK